MEFLDKLFVVYLDKLFILINFLSLDKLFIDKLFILINFLSSLRVNSLEFLDDLFYGKTIVLGLSISEDLVILTCVILTQCQRVTDRRTDGRTDGQLDRS